MGATFKITSFDWDKLRDAVKLQQNDLEEIAKIIIKGMVEGIKNSQTAADGRPLDPNSPRWKLKKAAEGAYTETLRYTGQLSEEGTYDIQFEDSKATITLIPSYTQIHLDLIEISQKTGKNYQDWWGISAEELVEIRQLLEKQVAEKLGKSS